METWTKRVAILFVALGAWLLGWTWSSVVLGLGSANWLSTLFGLLIASVGAVAVALRSEAREEGGARLFGRFVISALLGLLPSGLLIYGVSYLVATMIHDQEVELIALSVGAVGAFCAMPMVGGLSLLQIKARPSPLVESSAASETDDKDQNDGDRASDESPHENK